MLKLSKKVEYGLISMMHMDSVQSGELATARELSDLYNIPAELLGKVLQLLAKNRLIVSVQGAKGGYRLARGLDLVTLGRGRGGGGRAGTHRGVPGRSVLL